MESRPNDTSPEAWKRVRANERGMSPAERLERAVALSALAHSFALAGLRARHPTDDEETLRLRLAARMYGEELVRRALGWPPTDS